MHTLTKRRLAVPAAVLAMSVTVTGCMTERLPEGWERLHKDGLSVAAPPAAVGVAGGPNFVAYDIPFGQTPGPAALADGEVVSVQVSVTEGGDLKQEVGGIVAFHEGRGRLLRNESVSVPGASEARRITVESGWYPSLDLGDSEQIVLRQVFVVASDGERSLIAVVGARHDVYNVELVESILDAVAIS